MSIMAALQRTAAVLFCTNSVHVNPDVASVMAVRLGPQEPVAAGFHLVWCRVCPGNGWELWGARLGEPALSQHGLSQEACSLRAELMSRRIAGMARSRPCSAVLEAEACMHEHKH